MKTKEIIIENKIFDFLDKISSKKDESLSGFIESCSVDTNDFSEFIKSKYDLENDEIVKEILKELGIYESLQKHELESEPIVSEIIELENEIENELLKINNEAITLVKKETNRLAKRIEQLESEISIWENNLNLFKEEDDLLPLIEQSYNRIEKTKNNIARYIEYIHYYNLQDFNYVKDEFFLNRLFVPENIRHHDSQNLSQSQAHLLEGDKIQYLISIIYYFLEEREGFSFIGNNFEINVEEKNFYIDLVFYNRLLKSTVLLALKMEEISDIDFKIMQVCTVHFNNSEKMQGENDTVGILVAKLDNETMIKYTFPRVENILLSKYESVLPKEDEIKNIFKK